MTLDPHNNPSSHDHQSWNLYFEYDMLEHNILKPGQIHWLWILRIKICYPSSRTLAEQYEHCRKIDLPINIYERTGTTQEYKASLIQWRESLERKALIARLGGPERLST